MALIHRNLGRQVRLLREQRGWTQEILAARAGKHPTYIGGIERGERNPTVSVLESLAKALNVSIAELFNEPRKAGRS